MTYRPDRRSDEINSEFQYEIRFEDSFQVRAIRKRFVKKVYTILSLQLLVVTFMIAICIFVNPIKNYLKADIIIMICSLVLMLIFMIVLTCVRKARRNFPLNFILLSFLTIFAGMFLGSMSARYSTFICLASLGITAGSVIFISLIAALPCFDVTGWGLYLFIAGMVVSLFGFIVMMVMLFYSSKILFLVYAAVASLLFCLYLIYDTQLILGGRKHELSCEEYILGAVILFTDIINLYTLILGMTGAASS